MRKNRFRRLVIVSAAPASRSTSNRRPRFVKRGVLLSCAIAALLLLPAASRAIDFQFFYTDPAGQGFFDPVLGDQRRAALNAAGGIIGQLIRPSYGDETVNVRVTSFSDAGSIVLASANAAFFYSSFATSDPRYQTDTHYAKALASHYAGQDVDPGHDDIKMNVNLGKAFYFGTDAAPPATQFDFVSVAMHELIHGLGFVDSFRAQGGYGLFGDGTYDTETGVSGLALAYDRFVTVGAGGAPLIALNSANRQGELIGNNLYWGGANGIAGNGGIAPKLFAPNPFSTGSTVAHLDDATFPNDPMNTSIGPGVVKETPSPIDRGILRDIGWDVSVFSSTVNWTPAGVNNRASTLNNWSQSPYPGDKLSFSNNAAAVFDVRMDLQLYQLDKITFTVTAPAYTLRLSSFTSYDLTGFGIENDGIEAHTFVLESHQDEFSAIAIGSAAAMGFRNSATASNSIFEIHGGYSVAQHAPTDHYDRFNGAEVDFYNLSTAASATFNIQGAAGDGAPGIYARVNFLNASNAGSATLNNQPGRSGQALNGQIVAGFGGQTSFSNTASAGFAIINNIGQDSPYPGGTGGVTNFHDTSTAGGAVFRNMAATAAGFGIGVGGVTQFFDHSSGGNGTFINEASTFSVSVPNTYFGDDSTAANAVIDNLAGASNFGGTTTFAVRATASNAMINNHGLSGGGNGGLPGITRFHDDSSAGSAVIHNLIGPDTGGQTQFYDRSTAANAHIFLDPGNTGGSIIFNDNSTAGSAHLDAGADGTTGLIAFKGQSTAGNAVISLGTNNSNGLNLIFYDATSAGSATISVAFLSNVQFYSSSTAANSNITMGSNSSLYFVGSFGIAPTAANATIHLMGGSSASFANNASAANAQIIIDGAAAAGATGGTMAFGGGADAGNATILLKSSPVPGNPGGALYFNNASAPLARVTTEAGSLIYIVPSDTTIGSIEGAGNVNLGSSLLTVGGLGLNTTFSGPITGYPNAGSLVKIGAGKFILSGSSNYGGGTTVNGGALAVNGMIQGNATVNSGATLQGIGSIGGLVTVNNGGILSPGNSPGMLNVGALTLNSGSQTNIELGGATRGSFYDAIVSNGAASLNGTLAVSLINGFTPIVREDFDILDWGTRSGTFTAPLHLPILGGSLVWNTSQLYTTGVLSVIDSNFLPGDMNRDGLVNIADVSAMQTALADLNAYQATHGPGSGALSNLQLQQIGDLTDDNLVTNADIQGLIILLANGGLTVDGGGSLAAVPEPSSLVLLTIGLAAASAIRRGRRF